MWEIITSLTLANWAALATILAAMLSMSRKVRGCVIKIWDTSFGRTNTLLKKHIKQEEGQLNRIEAELHPNGGTSLRDIINKIAERQYGFEGYLNAQLNSQKIAVFRTNAEGKVLSNNRAHQHLTGFSKIEISGDGWINVIHPDWRDKTLQKWTKAVESQREFSEDIMYVHPDGHEYMVHVNVFREMDSNGNIRGYLGVVIPLCGKSSEE